MTTSKLDPQTTLFFLCDVQTKFSSAIHEYDQVVATSNKMVKLAKLLGCGVVCTTQNARALGPIDPAIDLQALGSLLLGNYDKTLFSMLVPEVLAVLEARPAINSIIIFGIESHVCVLQTVLSILSLRNYAVHVVADGVSSCNAFEIPIALDRMRREGAIITTSETAAFQLMGDAGSPTFKAFSRLIKEERERTKMAGELLLQGRQKVAQNLLDGDTGRGGVLGLKSAM